ncbi:PAS domain S-box protein [Methanospirillum hungatei]|uniref:PAS domain S-box protein n=1 Tax=Methanospirillum hungatei TaxID=2203 RepID=UPI0026F193B3|nr:PAS domain S-box protein [Methanospirillum hungatei]MCA1916558.1 PAS domain S-box protein [Methanospirillum hungatei]
MIPFVLLLSFILFIPLFIGAAVALFLWYHRREIQDDIAILSLAGLLLGESLYSATYSNELLLPGPEGYMFLVFFRYLGMFLFLVSMICFSFRFIGFWNRKSRIILGIISIPGIVSLFIIGTNSIHRLYYPNVIQITADIPHFVHTNGILYMPVQIYALLVLVLINASLLYWMFSSPRSYGSTVWLIFIGALSPLVGLILYQSGIRPFGFVNLVPFSLIITAVGCTLALVKYRLYTLRPIVYRSIFNEIPAGILLLDAENRIIDINHMARSLLQINRTDAINISLGELLPSNHQIFDVLASATQDHVEVSSGDRSLYLTKNSLAGLKGEHIGTLILLTDITRQKADEYALRQNDIIIRSTLDATKDGMLIVNQHHQIIGSNERFFRMWDVPDTYRTCTEEKKLLQVMERETEHPSSFSSLIQEIADGIVTHSDIISLKGGKVLEWYTTPLIITGQQMGRIWTFHDITDLKEKERSLKESESRLKLVLDNAPDLIWQLDMDGNFTYVSPSWTRVLGYAVDFVVGKNFRFFVHPDDISVCEQYLEKSFMKTETRPGVEYRVRHANGIWHWHYGSLIITYNSDADRYSVIGTSRDVNDIKIAEKSLKNANRQLNLLTSITRHDILNQVTGLIGYLEFALDEIPAGKVRTYLEECEYFTRTIQNQIEFTRVYEDIGSLEPVWQNIGEIMQKKRSVARITILPDVFRYEVYADPMLERVFDNLLDNSIRHGGHVTEITISCHEHEKTLEITYQDNGTGILNDEKSRIFKRGYGKNTGMGLFLVREILQLTGITIYETGEPGTGARFEMLVPEESFRVIQE